MNATDEQDQRELKRLHYWHIDRFVEIGFDRYQAEVLELRNVDWHEAEALIKHGCSPETAAQILI